METRKIVEIRTHSKFGCKNEQYTISLLLDNDTSTFFEQQYRYKEAEAFAKGLKEGIKLRDAGYRLDLAV